MGYFVKFVAYLSLGINIPVGEGILIGVGGIWGTLSCG